jgi:CBS domain containing-hemolysin-like protein
MPLLPDKKAEEIMIPIENYATIAIDSTLKEAVATLHKSMRGEDESCYCGRQTVLVTDNGKICGYVDIAEILTAIEPQFLKGGPYRGWEMPGNWAIPVFWEGLFNERCLTVANRRVNEIMHPLNSEIDVLDVNDTMIKAAYNLTKHGVNSIFVTKDGEVVGLLRNIEVFNEMHDLFAQDKVALRKVNKQAHTWPENMRYGKTQAR